MPKPLLLRRPRGLSARAQLAAGIEAAAGTAVSPAPRVIPADAARRSAAVALCSGAGTRQDSDMPEETWIHVITPVQRPGWLCQGELPLRADPLAVLSIGIGMLPAATHGSGALIEARRLLTAVRRLTWARGIAVEDRWQAH